MTAVEPFLPLTSTLSPLLFPFFLLPSTDIHAYMATTTTTTSSPRGFLGMGWGNSSLSRTLGRGGQRVVVPQALPVPSASTTAGGTEVTQDGKRQTLFGPHIGGDEEDDEFGGEGGGEGVKESVSVETVKGWIERSKSGEVSSSLPFYPSDIALGGIDRIIPISISV